MNTYLKVRVVGSRPVIVKVNCRKNGMVYGYAINAVGDEIGASRGSRTLVVAADSDIICEMVWNMRYAELEPKSVSV